MQIKGVQELQREWKEKGNPPCNHPNIDKEYYLGAQTGDYYCVICGETRWGRDGFKKKDE